MLSYALTTTARVKTFMGVTSSADDTLIERLIDSATNWIESYVGGRRFQQTAYTDDIYDGSGTNLLVLRNWPVSSTASFTLYERDNVLNENSWSAIDTELYFIDYNNGIVNYIDDDFGNYPRHWKLAYTAGYDYDNAATFLSDVGMADLEYACWVMVRDNYRKKGYSGDIQSESIGKYSVTFGDIARRNQEVKEILSILTRPMAF